MTDPDAPTPPDAGERFTWQAGDLRDVTPGHPQEADDVTDAPSPPDPQEAVQATPERPWLTVTEAAAAAQVDRRTVRRHLASGAFPSARQENTPTGPRWLIPADELLTVWPLHAPAGPGPEPADDGHRAPGQHDPDADLRAALSAAVHRAELAEAVAAERAALVAETREHLALALRMLNAGPPVTPTAPEPPAVTAPTQAERDDAEALAHVAELRRTVHHAPDAEPEPPPDRLRRLWSRLRA